MSRSRRLPAALVASGEGRLSEPLIEDWVPEQLKPLIEKARQTSGASSAAH